MFKIPQNDTYPNFSGTLVHGNNKPIDLTDCTVMFTMSDIKTRQRKIHAEAIITDAINGKVEYAWRPGDTDTPGDYHGNFKILYPTTKQQTVPNEWYVNIQIIPEI